MQDLPSARSEHDMEDVNRFIRPTTATKIIMQPLPPSENTYQIMKASSVEVPIKRRGNSDLSPTLQQLEAEVDELSSHHNSFDRPAVSLNDSAPKIGKPNGWQGSQKDTVVAQGLFNVRRESEEVELSIDSSPEPSQDEDTNRGD